MPVFKFEKCSMPDPRATAESGRPMYREGIEILAQIDKYSNIKFQMPAQGDDEPVASVLARVEGALKDTPDFLQTFEAWLRGQTFVSGTPLESVPWITPAQVSNLHSVGVNSLEALAAASDGVLSPLGMNASALRNQARAWMDEQARKIVGQVGQLSEENEALKETLAEQNAALVALQSEMAAMRAQIAQAKPEAEADGPSRRGPGRPKAKE